MDGLTFAWLLTAHFVGDFLLQSDWTAGNKSRRWDALALHGALYSACFLPWGIAFAVATFALHFAQDAVTSRVTSKLWFFRMEPGIWSQAEYTVPKHGRELVNPWTPIVGPRRHWFFVAIGADQLLHFWLLYATWLVVQP
jgi:hypothetical protein